jgi:hypothetical protein
MLFAWRFHIPQLVGFNYIWTLKYRFVGKLVYKFKMKIRTKLFITDNLDVCVPSSMVACLLFHFSGLSPVFDEEEYAFNGTGIR